MYISLHCKMKTATFIWISLLMCVGIFLCIWNAWIKLCKGKISEHTMIIKREKPGINYFCHMHESLLKNAITYVKAVSLSNYFSWITILLKSWRLPVNKQHFVTLNIRFILYFAFQNYPEFICTGLLLTFCISFYIIVITS